MSISDERASAPKVMFKTYKWKGGKTSTPHLKGGLPIFVKTFTWTSFIACI
jgi:hypothetical protein